MNTQIELDSRDTERLVGPAWDLGKPARGSFGSPESEDKRQPLHQDGKTFPEVSSPGKSLILIVQSRLGNIVLLAKN